MPSHIEVRRHPWAPGLTYRVVGGRENGRSLTIAEYDRLVAAGVPVIRR